MPLFKVIELFLLGAYTMYFIYTGSFLLKARYNRHCKVVGYAMILWGVLAIMSIYPFVKGDASELYNKISFILDMCDVASGWILLFTVSYLYKMTWSKAVIHYVPFVVFALCQLLIPTYPWTLVASVYSAVYCLVLLVPFYLHIVRYRDYIDDHYSNHDYINLAWLKELFSFFALLLVAWHVCTSSANTMTIYYIVSMFAWIMMVRRVTHQHELIEEQIGEDVVQKMRTDAKQQKRFVHQGEYPFSDELLRICQDQFYFTRPNFTLSDLAQVLHTEPALLTHYFRQELEVSFFEFVNMQRTSYASTILKTTDLDIEEVGRRSGFVKVSTFREIYKEDFGHYPEAERAARN